MRTRSWRSRQLSRRPGEFLRRLMALMLLACPVLAQELEPRAYSPSPVGTTFVVVTVGRSSGDVGFDPGIPLTDVHATLYSSALGLGQTFNFLGRQALITVAMPYAWGDISGRVGEQRYLPTRTAW